MVCVSESDSFSSRLVVRVCREKSIQRNALCWGTLPSECGSDDERVPRFKQWKTRKVAIQVGWLGAWGVDIAKTTVVAAARVGLIMRSTVKRCVKKPERGV